ncbi:retrovirus-related pol polyprotein from transposon TNT 1-94, partial [Tanacetum coccineum]
SSASASKASIVKNKSLIDEAYEWDEEEVSSDDNEMVEVKVLMALAEDNEAVSKEGAMNGEWVKISMRKCISEQIPTQKKRILRVDQLTKDPSSSRQKDLVFVKSLADDTKVSIPGVKRPWLSEVECFILPNHDTGRMLLVESQRNIIEPLVAITDSSSTDYDLVDESLICSTPLPPLNKLDGVEPIPGPKTIKSILRGNKSSSASKVNSAPAGKLKSVKIEDDPPLAIDHFSKKRNQAQKPSFRRGETLQAKKVEALKSTKAELSNANKSKTPTKSGCSRHMTGVKSYLHKYVEQPGPKVVFRDDSTCTTEGYGSIKCNGIVFIKKRGTIFNSNKEVVMITPRVRDVYVLDMTSSAQESCFFAKASKNLNWLWHKRLAHLNFKTINSLAKQNFVIGLPSLVYSNDKPCSSCEKEKHHRASFKTKQTFSIKKCLHLFHMDLFGPVTPRSINHEKYTIVIVDEYSRYPLDKYLHPYEPSQRYQTNNSEVSFIEPYESLELVVLGTEVSSDQNAQTNQNDLNDQNDQSAQTNEILNNDQSEHSNHDTSVHDTIPIPNPYLSIASMTSPVPQDRCAASAHECLFEDFLSEEEPKKVSEALQHLGWVDAIQEELNVFARNKV